MTEEQTTVKTLAAKMLKPNSVSDSILLIGLVVVGALLVGVFIGGGKFLLLLKDSEVSRGLITFLVALTTVFLAIILTLYAITAEDKETIKERFSLGKEVLTTLVGILGTVLGFYFGSAEKAPPNQLGLAKINFHGQQLMTHVSGGTPPYRYSVTSAGQTFSKIESRLSKDGWILETLDKQPPAGTAITVDVSDAKDKSVSLISNFPTDQPSEKPSKGAASVTSTLESASPAPSKP